MPRSEEANKKIKEQRRHEILEGATKVFARKGLTDTRIADIAAESGMSQGLIYLYFGSKEEVFTELVKVTWAVTLNLLEQARLFARPGMDRLVWLTNHLLPFIYFRPQGAQILIHALTNEAVPVAAKEAAMEYVTGMLTNVRQFIAEGQATNQINQRDPDQLAWLYISTLHGLNAGASFMKDPPSGYPDTEAILGFLRP